MKGTCQSPPLGAPGAGLRARLSKGETVTATAAALGIVLKPLPALCCLMLSPAHCEEAVHPYFS